MFLYEMKVTLTLQSALVLSARSVTVGHESLDYIPGSAIQGAVANRLYNQLDQNDAWRIFHSGAVSFGNALPMIDGQTTLPAPLCWHYQKGEPYKQAGKLIAKAIFSHPETIIDAKKQPKQIRSGFVNEYGNVVTTQKGQTIKTAIDPQTGRSQESQLFSYETLAAGQQFAAHIFANSEEDLKNIAEALSGSIKLGRSKSAEFGSVHCQCDPPVQCAEIAEIAEINVAQSQASSQKLTLWLTSDAALINQFGQPTLLPTTEDLGLPPGRLDSKYTFIRTRRYSVFNGKRQQHDSQREVLVAGSILSYQFDEPISEQQWQRLRFGIGQYTEVGLGRMVVNPLLLHSNHPESNHPEFKSKDKATDSITAGETTSAQTLLEKTQPAASQDIAKPDFISWLEQQGNRKRRINKAPEKVTELLKSLDRFEASIKALSPHISVAGVSPTQWSAVQRITQQQSSIKNLKKHLFEGDQAICKERSKADKETSEALEWSCEGSYENKIRTLKQWFDSQIDRTVAGCNQDEALALEVIAQFAAKARERRKQMNSQQEAADAQ